MTRYIPFPFYSDDVPLDLSFIFADERPAGRHGFLTARADGFFFEDGTPGRFWGTNFNGGACFPSREYSRAVAARLAKIGVNIVRFHQLDAEWNTPNIFAFTKGNRRKNTRALDPESLERLDYLVFCLKNEGVYCYLDLLTYRKFKTGDGVEDAFALSDAAKPYSIYDRKLIELQKEYARELWTHKNPYTGLEYRDDPVFVLCEITNECDLFSQRACALTNEHYVKEFRALFSEWCEKNGVAFDCEGVDVNSSDPTLIEFKIALTRGYYGEMRAYIRSLGVKIPLTGTNWTKCGANIKCQTGEDFTDSHYYFYDWKWGETEKYCFNRSLCSVETTGLGGAAKMRLLDKPFFMSEWDMPWPNTFRAESPILLAAVSALQNWGGMAIHTYAYGTRLDDMNILGKEVSSSSIGGVPYREGIFSAWNDPAKFGLFYHSALIVRRADVSPAKKRTAVEVKRLDKAVSTALDLTVEQSMTGSCFGRDDGANTVGEDETTVDRSAGEVRSDNGELYRSWKKQYGSVDTERTKCFYGFLGRQGEISVDGLSAVCLNDYAVIALSSLSDSPISDSDNLLLTTVGRARNTGSVSDGDRMLDYGRPPVTVEVIDSRISIRTSQSGLRVWAVNAEGFFIGALDSVYKDGVLSFRTGEKFPSMYYLIQAE